jgi:hypothetical protein
MAASVLTVILFFLYTWGLGFTATYYLKMPISFLERLFVNIGTGLGVFAILSVVLNFFRIPLDWRIFLLLSIAFPLYILFTKRKLPKIKVTKSDLVMLLVLGVFLISFYMYSKGAFAYPYLEDEDPWGHSVGMKYVAFERSAYSPAGKEPNFFSYMDPYPPAYAVLGGVLHQTAPDLNWSIKFFNALLISLGLVFFYLFAKEFMLSRNKALFATLLLAATPSYLSHFIWAHVLVVTLFFPMMYAFGRIGNDKRWWIVAMLMVAAVWVSQNISQPIKISTMLLLYLVAVSVVSKKWLKYHYAAFVGGGLLSLVWWGAMIKKYTFSGFLSGYGNTIIEGSSSVSGGGSKVFSFLSSVLASITAPGGSASRAYTLTDFFVATKGNMINNPIGVGKVLSLLTILGVVYLLVRYRSRLVTEGSWRIVALLWLVFTFWGVNGMTFPVSVAKGSFRVWMLMAIPMAMVATEGLYSLLGLFKKYKLVKWVIVVIVLFGVFQTSFVQKYAHNTTPGWPTGGAFQGNLQEAREYGDWFLSLEPNTKVFLLSPRDKITIGFGAYACYWCDDEIEFRSDVLKYSASEMHQFLRNKGYEYFVINGRMDLRYLDNIYGEEGLAERLNAKYVEYYDSGLFIPAETGSGDRYVMFRVK